MYDNSLPFERGTSFKTDGDGTTASGGTSLIGRRFSANSNHPGANDVNQVGGDLDVELTVVRNYSQVALTFGDRSLRRGVLPMAGTNTDGRRLVSAVSGFVATKGVRGYPIDGPYGPASTARAPSPRTAKSFVSNDLFYVVKEGPCLVPLSRSATRINATQAGSTTLPIGTPMAWAEDGGCARAGTADSIFGLSGEVFTTAQTGQEIVVHVGAQLGSQHSHDGTV